MLGCSSSSEDDDELPSTAAENAAEVSEFGGKLGEKKVSGKKASNYSQNLDFSTFSEPLLGPLPARTA